MDAIDSAKPQSPAPRDSRPPERNESPDASGERPQLLRWSRTDSILIGGLLLAAAATRLPGLGNPAELVYDEKFPVTTARYLLQRVPYRNTHLPLAGELIAISIRLFGDRPWSWRLPDALTGIALVGITYLLGRRLFNSRLASALAAILVTCDGLFLVESRLAMWEIFFLTFAACSYLMLFRFAQTADPVTRRRSLVWLGVAIGLCLGSKLGMPFVTYALVAGSLAIVILRLEAGM